MAIHKILPVFIYILYSFVGHSEAEVEKRQADCFSPFYKPPWCYGAFGGFGGGFGAPGFGGGFGFGGPGFGFGGPAPGFKGYGKGVGAGASFSTHFGGGGDEFGEEEEEEPFRPPPPSRYRPGAKQPKKSRYGSHPFVGAGGYAGAGFGDFGGPYGGFGGPGFGGPGFGGFAGGFGGFGPGFGAGFGGAPFYNPYVPPFDFSDMPMVKSKGPGFHTTSGSSTYSFGPGGKTTTSTSNQMVTTKAPDGEWTIQASGIEMEAQPSEGTILVTAQVGKPTRIEKEIVSEHEFQVNFSYKDEPKKWINLKVDSKGPNVAGMNVLREGDTVTIRGPAAKVGTPK